MAAARTEILGSLKRRKHREVNEKTLTEGKLRCSALGWEFHLADAVGKGLVERVRHGNNAVIRIRKT